MRRFLIGMTAVLFCVSATAEHHESVEAEVLAAAEGFNTAYATNDVEGYFDYYADVGTGQADFTWQTKLGFGYNFNKWTGTFGFRYMRYNLLSGSDLKNLEIVGPYLGAKWTW